MELVLFVVVATLFCFQGEVSSAEVGGGDEGGGNNSWFLTSTQTILVSVAVVCTIILVAVGCTWAWWKRVLCFWRNSSNQSVASGRASWPESESRDRDSVTISAFPTLQELGLDGRESFQLRTYRTLTISVARTTPLEEPPYFSEISDWLTPNEKSFPRTNLEYQRIIGKGWFGKVLESEALNIKQYVRASNVIVRELRNNAVEQEQVRFLEEARVFRSAREQGCEHVLKLLGFCVEQLPYILIFEYFPLGNLKSYLKSRSKVTPGQFKAGDDGVLTRMVIDIIRGVKWLEQAGFVHGDLAARNCLVATSSGKVVIGDYGTSLQNFKTDYYWCAAISCAIPIRWAAPETLAFGNEANETSTLTAPVEMVRLLETTPEAMIWSLGVVIWEVFQLGKTPYDSLSNEDVIRRVIQQKSFILEPPQLPFVKDATKESIYQLLVACWNSTPSQRPSIDAIERVFTTPA